MARMTKSAAMALNVRKASEAELWQSYTALRDVMNKQIKRLAAGTEIQKSFAAPFLSGGKLNLQTTASFRREVKNLPPDAGMRSLRYSVENLHALLQSPRLSLQGWREIEKRTLETLQEHGYENLNKGNLKQFGDYMEAMRDLYGSTKFFPSAEVAEAYSSLAGSTRGKISSQELGDLMMKVRKGGSNGVDLFAW